MPARNPATGLILRQSLLSTTSICGLYPAYGQSNSDHTNGLMPVTVSDPTNGAAAFFGRDGLGSRDGTTAPVSWVDKSLYPPTVTDYSALPDNTIDEPLRVYLKGGVLDRLAIVLNERQIAATGQRHFSRFASYGYTGYTIAQLIKGTNSYTNFINGCARMYSAAVGRGYTARFNAIPWVQGEADFATSGSGYAATLAQFQIDAEADLKAISGQSGTIPLVTMQQSNFSCNYAAGIAYPVLDQLAAHIAYPGKIILAGPMYSGETDGADGAGGFNLHYREHQSSRWASIMGNAVATVVIDGLIWNPIRPKTVSCVGNVITIQFWVPVGPLVLDTTYATNPVDGNYGFDYHQTGGTTTLVSVTQIAADTLQFTLSGTPDGSSPFIRAGSNLTGSPTNVSGFRTGARTCLRDSASPDQRYANYCAHFDQAIT